MLGPNATNESTVFGRPLTSAQCKTPTAIHPSALRPTRRTLYLAHQLTNLPAAPIMSETTG